MLHCVDGVLRVVSSAGFLSNIALHAKVKKKKIHFDLIWPENLFSTCLLSLRLAYWQTCIPQSPVSWSVGPWMSPAHSELLFTSLLLLWIIPSLPDYWPVFKWLLQMAPILKCIPCCSMACSMFGIFLNSQTLIFLYPMQIFIFYDSHSNIFYTSNSGFKLFADYHRYF